MPNGLSLIKRKMNPKRVANNEQYMNVVGK